MLSLLLFFSRSLLRECDCLKIALHAQVAPIEKIVGSVITTDGWDTAILETHSPIGLSKALKRRKEVTKVEVFYPFHYSNFISQEWDLVIIEGWFPMINDFIFLARTEFPKVTIIYYCLDPVFPPLNTTLSLDVDGYATNSLKMRSILSNNSPAFYLPLAADADVMVPNYSLPRIWDCIYIGQLLSFSSFMFSGAGGHMLKVKPLLRSMLLACNSPKYKLRLHGSNWDESSDENIRISWQGMLPKDEIANAYSSAKVVLANTIKEQADFGMINNRIFEALACGSLVVSDRFEALDDMLGKVIFFVNASDDIQSHLSSILTSEEKYLNRRYEAREIIMKYHTWDHRAIPLLQFYASLTAYKKEVVRRASSLDIALIVSDILKGHGDLNSFILPSLFNFFNRGYQIEEFDAYHWRRLVRDNLANISRYSVIIAIFTPYDSIHRSFFNIDQHDRRVLGRDSLQKRLCYILGGPPTLEFILKVTPFWYRSLTDMFDVVLYRDLYEMNKFIEVERMYQLALHPNEFYKGSHRLSTSFNLRWQHAFGVAPIDICDSPYSESIPLVMCMYHSMSFCTHKIRNSLLSNDDYNLVLIGGTFSEWLDFCVSDLDIDCILRSTKNFTSLAHSLSHTYHYSGYHDQILSLLCSTEKVYFFYDVQKKDDTLTDELWPLVSAAVYNRPMHFLHPLSPHLAEVISDGCENWGSQYLHESWKRASERLHGLASSSSKVAILANYQDGMVVKFSQVDRQPLIIFPKLENFVAGRDGKVCLHVNSIPQICLIREYLELEIHFDSHMFEFRYCSFVFTLVLQSHMFADTFYISDPFEIQINSDDVLGVLDFNLSSTKSTSLFPEMEKVHVMIHFDQFNSSCRILELASMD